MTEPIDYKRRYSNFTFSSQSRDETREITDAEHEFPFKVKVKGYTIDGPKSKDLDDGFNISKSGDDYILQISIADTAEFIGRESSLFKPATP